MIYQVKEGGGDPVRVDLKETGENLYQVEIDGEVFQVDVVTDGRNLYSLLENGRQFEAVINEQGAERFDVQMRGRLFHLDCIDERTQLLANAAGTVIVGKQNVKAEIPGKVVKVSVEPGAVVSVDEGVMIVEAMKMENEIVSPIDGVVTEVPVAQGDTVEAGDTLFVVEPLTDEGEAKA